MLDYYRGAKCIISVIIQLNNIIPQKCNLSTTKKLLKKLDCLNNFVIITLLFSLSIYFRFNSKHARFFCSSHPERNQFRFAPFVSLFPFPAAIYRCLFANIWVIDVFIIKIRWCVQIYAYIFESPFSWCSIHFRNFAPAKHFDFFTKKIPNRARGFQVIDKEIKHF